MGKLNNKRDEIGRDLYNNRNDNKKLKNEKRQKGYMQDGYYISLQDVLKDSKDKLEKLEKRKTLLEKKKGGKKKKILVKKIVRKHRGIVQIGGNKGRLRKGYKYTGKKLKSGVPQIIKCRINKF